LAELCSNSIQQHTNCMMFRHVCST
jgi:hypothetical protein